MATDVQSPVVTTESKDVVRVRVPAPVVLRGVPYGLYVALRDLEENHHVRMTYHDGTLEIMSPQPVHEVPSIRIGLLIRAVAIAFAIPYQGVRSSTMRRGEGALTKGHGKEPDESFYLANAARIVGKPIINLDAGDPPPDLWIEVDNRSSSRGRLPVYAALGVPEVWRYRVRGKRLVFVRLTNEGTYEAIDRSLSLPMLTPALVLEALAMGEGLLESAWQNQLQTWIGERLRNA